ncbi:hypothetical protein BC827DRAFT_1252562, partial [Russula dissimulans]
MKEQRALEKGLFAKMKNLAVTLCCTTDTSRCTSTRWTHLLHAGGNTGNELMLQSALIAF